MALMPPKIPARSTLGLAIPSGTPGGQNWPSILQTHPMHDLALVLYASGCTGFAITAALDVGAATAFAGQAPCTHFLFLQQNPLPMEAEPGTPGGQKVPSTVHANPEQELT